METTRIGVLSAGSAGGVISTGISVAVGAGVPLGGIGVAVGGMDVAVGTDVSLGGIDVIVGGMDVAVGTGVSLGGIDVIVGGMDVAVGTGVSLGGMGVAVSGAMVSSGDTSLVAISVAFAYLGRCALCREVEHFRRLARGKRLSGQVRSVKRRCGAG